MASITLSQTRASDSGMYSVTSTVTAAVGMPPEVFVYLTDSGDYSHVAMLDDLKKYPNSVDPSYMFHRQLSVTQLFSNIEDARRASDTHKQHVESLVNEYTAVEETFAGTEVVTFTG